MHRTPKSSIWGSQVESVPTHLGWNFESTGLDVAVEFDAFSKMAMTTVRAIISSPNLSITCRTQIQIDKIIALWS
jgi:hypothetical protein